MKLFTKKSNNKVIDKNDSFINPKVLEVNLVKDEIGVDFNWRRHLVSLFLTFLVAFLFVLEIYYGLDWWQKQEESRTAAINMEYEGVVSDIKDINNKSKDFSIFKDKVAITGQIADTHIYWTNYFNWLEKNTLNTVIYSGFSGDISGKYTLAATAKTFSDISWQVKAFSDSPLVDSARVDSGAAGRSEADKSLSTDIPVSFSINLQVKPQIFYRQAE